MKAGFLAAGLAVGMYLPLGFGTDPVSPSSTDIQTLPHIDWNDNLEAVGRLREGTLDLELEIVEGMWHPLGDEKPGGRVFAFREAGGEPLNPGPMIRVPLGTEVRVSITNRADTAVVVNGLGARLDGAPEPLRVEPGATARRGFVADVEGTYFYWGSFLGRPLNQRRFEDSQLTGALIVDGPTLPDDDRILVVSEWFDGRLEDGSPDPTRLFLSFNGRPWPHAEQMEYDLGDTIQWRIINTSLGSHAFHLHGFFYTINAKGDLARDTLYWPAQRRDAVTERMPTGTTMQMAFVPDRPGGWIFHCHMSIHVVPNPSMEERISEEEFEHRLYREEHGDAGAMDHARSGMGGLVSSVYVRPPEGWQPEEVARRELDVFVQSRPAEGGKSGAQFSYVLQEGETPPAADSVLLPSSTLLLLRGEPTRIRVTNRTPEPTQVHWHGLEIESYFDGVAGVGGYPRMPTPVIAPGESWDVFVTPSRAGSYMYHSHVNDLRQQGSGLYGPLVVLDEDETWDPETDRIFIFGESPFRSDDVPVVNGGAVRSAPMEVGTTYRIRLMQITSNRPETYVALLKDGFPVVWTPIAKDAFALPDHQRVPTIAQQKIAVGETYDRLYTPTSPGTLRLEYRVGNGALLLAHEIPVVN